MFELNIEKYQLLNEADIFLLIKNFIMINIVSKSIDFETELKKKIKFICDFVILNRK